MSYNTIYKCANDPEFQGRIQACAAQEGAKSPGAAMTELIWPVSTAADIEQAYAYALTAGNEHPGGDETVITDQMILSAVQANLVVTPATP